MASAQDILNEAVQEDRARNVRVIPKRSKLQNFFRGARITGQKALNNSSDNVYGALGSFVNTRSRIVSSNQGIMRPSFRQGKGKKVNGGRGRPRGSFKYRDDQGRPIGVYEARMILRAKLRAQANALRQRSVLSPGQQYAVQAYNQQRYAQAQNQEAAPIPDTSGKVSMADYMKEIEDASNVFG